jgi:TRAP-type C4-dicarboxylate transport system permease small subunit
LWLFAKGSWQQTVIGMDSVTPVTGVPLAAFAVVGVITAVSMALLFIIDLFRLVTGRVRDDELIQVRGTADQETVVVGRDEVAVTIVPVPAEGTQR